MLLNEPLANSQTVAWSIVGLDIEQNLCFIIVPIIVYLSFVVNLLTNLVAEDGFAPPIFRL